MITTITSVSTMMKTMMMMMMMIRVTVAEQVTIKNKHRRQTTALRVLGQYEPSAEGVY